MLPVFANRLSYANDTAPPHIYTLSLHDALPIYVVVVSLNRRHLRRQERLRYNYRGGCSREGRRNSSVAHTSALHSRGHIVRLALCRDVPIEAVRTTLDFTADCRAIHLKLHARHT